jgi:hypothetical protein
MSNNNQSIKQSAVTYQSLYLMNLLLIPGLSFVVLLWLFVKNKQQQGWQRIHLYRSIQLSVFAGVFIIVIPVLVLLFATEFEASVMVMLLYFVSLHAAFVLIGMLNLSRAMAKKLPLF